MRTITPPELRFWPKVEKTETCWLWTAAKNPNGYGAFGITRTWTTRAHRFAYEQVKGPIPDGLHLDHLCRVRHCVNPDHLEAVTPRENVLRGEGLSAQCARKTHCDQGHELELQPRGTRGCTPCRKAKDRVRAAERRRATRATGK